MNLKDWMKLEEDEKTVTLIHPKGHKMTIYSYALPKIQREQLKRLKFAKGGQVKPKVESNDHLAPAVEVGGGVSEQGKDVRAAKSAHLRPELTGVEADKKADQHQKYAKDEARGRREMERTIKPKMKGLAKGGAVAHYDDGTPDQPVSADDVPIPQFPMQSAPNYQQPGLTNQANATLQGVQQGAEAINQNRDIDIAKAKMAEQSQNDLVEGLKSKQQADAAANQRIREATDDFNAYVQNNPLNPKHYQESMSSGQKTATAIGLFLGGMGSAFGGHNYAQDFLDKQIDRDIDAQKQNYERQKNVYGAYQKLFEDDNISTALAKASMYDIRGEQVKQQALRLGTPEAVARANALQSDYAQKSMELRNAAATLASGKIQQSQQPAPHGQNQPTGTGSNSVPKNKKGKDWYDSHVLAPDADSIALRLQYNPLAKPNLPAIQEQKARADLADKALATIDDRFPKIAGTVGESSYARNQLEPFMAGIPLAGQSLARAVHTYSDNPSSREYDTHRSAIVGAVRGALQGNVSDQLLDDTVMSNLPEKGDDAEATRRKMKTLKEFIKSHTRTDLLRPFKMSKD